jgi:hypothetical protein
MDDTLTLMRLGPDREEIPSPLPSDRRARGSLPKFHDDPEILPRDGETLEGV